MKYPKGENRCDRGYIRTRPRRDGYDHPGANRWRFGRCGKCDVVTWPFALRVLDPTWWPSTLRSWKWSWDERRWWR